MTDAPHPDLPHPSRLALVPLAGAGLAFTSYVAAGMLASGRNAPAGTTVGLATALSALFAVALVPLCRRAAPALGAWAVAVALLAQGFLPALGALHTLADPIVSSHWRCGTGDVALVMLAPMVGLGAGLAGLVAVRFALPLFTPRLGRLFHGVAAVTGIAVVTLALAGALAVAQKPQARAYLAGLPALGELPAVTLTPTMATRVDTVGDVLVWRRCDEHGCDVDLRNDPPMGESLQRGGVRRGAEALRVRRDAAHGLLVLEDVQTGTPTAAFDLRTRRPTDITWRTLAGTVAPPVAWLASALAGLLLALVAFASGQRALHDLRRWLGAREATLSEDGVVRFEGETDTAKVQGVTGLRPGPVLVRGDAAAKPFREMATVPTALLRAGTLETLRASVALAEAGRYVLAATVAAWSAAPLILALASLTAR